MGLESRLRGLRGAPILFLRKFGPAMRERAVSPSRNLAMLAKLAGRPPTPERLRHRSEPTLRANSRRLPGSLKRRCIEARRPLLALWLIVINDAQPRVS